MLRYIIPAALIVIFLGAGYFLLSDAATPVGSPGIGTPSIPQPPPARPQPESEKSDPSGKGESWWEYLKYILNPGGYLYDKFINPQKKE